MLRTLGNSIRKVSRGFSAREQCPVDYSSISASRSRSETECTAGKPTKLRDCYQFWGRGNELWSEATAGMKGVGGTRTKRRRNRRRLGVMEDQEKQK